VVTATLSTAVLTDLAKEENPDKSAP